MKEFTDFQFMTALIAIFNVKEESFTKSFFRAVELYDDLSKVWPEEDINLDINSIPSLIEEHAFYDGKRLTEIDDNSLVSWYVMFMNGADRHTYNNWLKWAMFRYHVFVNHKDNEDLKDRINYLDEVI